MRERVLSLGFVHTLTEQSWKYVEAITEFAADVDAQLVQIHRST